MDTILFSRCCSLRYTFNVSETEEPVILRIALMWETSSKGYCSKNAFRNKCFPSSRSPKRTTLPASSGHLRSNKMTMITTMMMTLGSLADRLRLASSLSLFWPTRTRSILEFHLLLITLFTRGPKQKKRRRNTRETTNPKTGPEW